MSPTKVVAIDLDGVLAEYNGWKGEAEFGLPIPGALEFIRTLQTRDYEPVIHTTRQEWRVAEWLERHGFPALRIASTKPPAVAYVDDRAVRFRGDFDAVLNGIEAPPWWEDPSPRLRLG